MNLYHKIAYRPGNTDERLAYILAFKLLGSLRLYG